ncbi:MAG TPA: hypothetical protein VLT62_08835 [Candidatus Methylomirabilis sp.]|nr:hypothetical protein [Candidatus Methylomirabilis sp.]
MKTLRGPMVLAALVIFASTSVPVGHVDAQTPSVAVVQSSGSVYMYPDGRYELRGDGTANSPYFWVWIPAGTVAQPPAPPYGFQSGLKSTEGRIDSVGFFGTSITLDDGQEFVIPFFAAKATQPAIGQEVIVTYYVAQDGRNIVRSLDPNSGR